MKKILTDQPAVPLNKHSIKQYITKRLTGQLDFYQTDEETRFMKGFSGFSTIKLRQRIKSSIDNQHLCLIDIPKTSGPMDVFIRLQNANFDLRYI